MADHGVRFLALNRDEAKQVFSRKDPAGLAEFVESLWQDAARHSANRNLKMDGDATAHAACIDSNRSLDAAAKSLLTRGGRLLPSSTGAEIYLIRPDMLGPLSLAVSSMEHLSAFLTSAASQGEAVVIVY